MLNESSVTSFIEPYYQTFWKKNENANEKSMISLNTSVRTSQQNPFRMTLGPNPSKLLNVDAVFGRTRIFQPDKIKNSIQREHREKLRNRSQLSTYEHSSRPTMMTMFNEDEERMDQVYK